MTYDCPAGSDCYGLQICSGAGTVMCSAGLYCPGYVVQQSSIVSGELPDLCPKGYYCPSPSRKIQCPAGYFCPAGTSSPQACGSLSLCPEGSYYQVGYLGVLLCLFIPAIAVGALWYYSRLRDSKRVKRDTVRRTMGSPMAMQDDAERQVSLLDEHSRDGVDEPRKFHDLSIEFQNLSYSVNSKHILQGISTRISGGRCTCIMGPSGAGKTTFLAALMGKIEATSGSILFNGRKSTGQEFQRVVGFVPQDDTMIRTLSPKETLQYCAAYRLPSGTSARQRSAIVNHHLQSLGLTHVRHTLIGDALNRGISGGQRRRVSIGQELVSDPLLLFLDEPTSGLDATSSYEVVQSLAKIAGSGRVVAAVIHQPRAEAFELFDDLILLAKGGYLAYSGSVASAVSYYEGLGYSIPENCNPADFLLDVVSMKAMRKGGEPLSPVELSEAWLNHVHNASSSSGSASAIGDPIPSRKSPHFGMQFAVFLRRSFLQQFRDKRSIVVSLFIQFLGGFLIGSASTPDKGPMYLPPVSGSIAESQCPYIIRNRCLSEPLSSDALMINVFYLSLACGVAAVARAVPVFGDEKAVIRRESASGRSTLAYFAARNVADLPMIVFGTLLFASTFFSIAVPQGSFAMYFGAFLAMQLAATGMGYFISVIASDENSMVVSIVMSIVFSICCGWQPTLKTMRDSFPFLEALWSLSYARFGGEAMYISEVEHYRKDFYVEGGYAIQGYKSDFYGLDIFICIVIALVWRVMTYGAMRRTLRAK